MSDYEYDTRLKELEAMEKEQGWRNSDSPTITVGSDLTKADTSNLHKRRMESLENTYNMNEVEKWYEDMRKATGVDNPEVVVNPKWDGMSGALRYENGELYKALSRGDGNEGEDLTQNIKYCDKKVWIPKKKSFSGEARGELIMTKEGFDVLNTNNDYQNARNLVSGSLKLLDINEFIPRAPYIKFYAYWLEDSNNDKYEDDFKQLNSIGFETNIYFVCKSLSEIKAAINKIETMAFAVAIDGAVMKLNDKKYWKQIGSTAKYPKWAKAYKYKQQTATTTVKNIEFYVGRTGKITPLAWFTPVFIDGSTIQKATLNNKEFYEAMNIAIGDEITVHKAAAIIPQILSIENRPTTRKVVPFPKTCPCCGSKLVKHNDEHADWFCDNIQCKSRIIDQIANFTHALEIDGFAEVIIERLHNAEILNSIPDLYNLKNNKTKAAQLDRLSDKIIDKLCVNIENSKSAPFWKLLSGIGIPNVAGKTAKVLANYFKSMKALESATVVELMNVEGIAEITAEGIKKFFNENKPLIRALEAAGCNMNIEEKTEDDKPKIDLTGKNFCITGLLSLPRTKYIELIETCGGKVVGAVNKKTSYLITNDKMTGTKKNIEAKKLGIPILSEKELLEMCDSLHLLKEMGL